MSDPVSSPRFIVRAAGPLERWDVVDLDTGEVVAAGLFHARALAEAAWRNEHPTEAAS